MLIWGKRFHEKSPWSGQPYDYSSVAAKMKELILEDSACLFLHDNGMIGGNLLGLFFSPSSIFASEMFWWSEGGGGDLLRAFEAWAKDAGAAGVIMAAEQYESRSENDRMDEIYAAKGYRPQERHYIRYF